MATQRFLQVQELILSGSGITSTATSFTVRSFQTPAGTNITTSDLGTTNYGTFEPGTAREEIFSFTGVTQNSDGTATLTGVTRNLDYKTPYTQISATGFTHAGGTVVVISNNPQLYNDLASTVNTETISEVWTYENTAYPRLDTYIAPTADQEFAPKRYVDDTAGGTPVSINRIVPVATAGETIAAGQVCYFDTTQNEWMLADSDVAAESDNVLLGIAQGAGVDGGAIAGGILLAGLDSNQSGMTAGDIMYLATTSGSIANSAGTQEVEVGIAHSATELYFSPRFASVPTGDEKDALAGNNGTPATANTFVTQTGFQRATEVYAASTTGNDTYVVTLSPVPAALVAGMTIRFRPDTANTGAATLNPNSLGATSITKNGGTALENNDIRANQVVTVVYDGTNFEIQSVADKISTANAATLTDGSEAGTLHTHRLIPGFSTLFETAGRFNAATGGTASNTFGSQGLTQQCTAVSSSALVDVLSTIVNLFDRDITGATIAEVTTGAGVNVRGEAWFIVADNSSFGTNTAAQNLTETARHIGFKYEWVSDSSLTLSASNADGTTQTITDVSSGLTLTNNNVLSFIKTSTSIRFFVNGTLVATHTTNIPAAGTGELLRNSLHTTAAGSAAVDIEWLSSSVNIV